MNQTELLKHVDDFIKGHTTIRDCLAKTAEYCDYHNDKLDESNRLVFDLTAENGTLTKENDQLKELYKASAQTINEMDFEINSLKRFVAEINEAYMDAIRMGVNPNDTAVYFINWARVILRNQNPAKISITIKTAFGDPFEADVIYMADIIEAVVKQFGVVGDDLVINEKAGKAYTNYKGNLSALANKRFVNGEWVVVSEMGGAV